MLGSGSSKSDDGGPAVLTALPPPPGSKRTSLSHWSFHKSHAFYIARAHATHAAHAPQAAPQAAQHDVGWGDFQQAKPAAPQGSYFAAGGAGHSAYRTLRRAVCVRLVRLRAVHWDPCRCQSVVEPVLMCRSAASRCQRSTACVPNAATPPASDGARLAAGDVPPGRRAAGTCIQHPCTHFLHPDAHEPHQSLFGQPQQQPMGISPQMMSPQVQGTDHSRLGVHVICDTYLRPASRALAPDVRAARIATDPVALRSAAATACLRHAYAGTVPRQMSGDTCCVVSVVSLCLT